MIGSARVIVTPGLRCTRILGRIGRDVTSVEE